MILVISHRFSCYIVCGLCRQILSPPPGTPIPSATATSALPALVSCPSCDAKKKPKP